MEEQEAHMEEVEEHLVMEEKEEHMEEVEGEQT